MDGTMTGDKPTNAAAYTSVTHVEERTGNRQPGLQPASYALQPGFTTVPLHLAERESVFVVFRDVAQAPSRTVPVVAETTLATLDDSWTLSFPAHWGAPPSVTMPKLVSWTSNTDPGVKYFSGTATYSKTIQAQATWFRAGQRIWLDLGEVRDIAEVKINGKSAGITWAPPYRLDVTTSLHAGSNKIEIAVTNEWTNRQLGDRLLPEAQQILSPSGLPPRPGSAGALARPQVLPESGLLGDVRLVAIRPE